MAFDFALVPQPVFTSSTHVVAWPQGDQLLGGGAWHKADPPAANWLPLPFYAPEGAWPQPIHLGSEVGEGQRCKRGRPSPPPPKPIYYLWSFSGMLRRNQINRNHVGWEKEERRDGLRPGSWGARCGETPTGESAGRGPPVHRASAL